MHICDPHRLLQIFGFNGVSSTAEGSVIGSEAERKRMLMGGGGGKGGCLLDPSGRLYRGESVKRVVGDSGRVYKQNECVFDHVRWQFNGELKIRRPRRQRERQKKAIDLAPLHMTPVDRGDPDDPG